LLFTFLDNLIVLESRHAVNQLSQLTNGELLLVWQSLNILQYDLITRDPRTVHLHQCVKNLVVFLDIDYSLDGHVALKLLQMSVLDFVDKVYCLLVDLQDVRDDPFSGLVAEPVHA